MILSPAEERLAAIAGNVGTVAERFYSIWPLSDGILE